MGTARLPSKAVGKVTAMTTSRHTVGRPVRERITISTVSYNTLAPRATRDGKAGLVRYSVS